MNIKLKCVNTSGVSSALETARKQLRNGGGSDISRHGLRCSDNSHTAVSWMYDVTNLHQMSIFKAV